jgi:hypothetical protein
MELSLHTTLNIDLKINVNGKEKVFKEKILPTHSLQDSKKFRLFQKWVATEDNKKKVKIEDRFLEKYKISIYDYEDFIEDNVLRETFEIMNFSKGFLDFFDDLSVKDQNIIYNSIMKEIEERIEGE